MKKSADSQSTIDLHREFPPNIHATRPRPRFKARIDFLDLNLISESDWNPNEMEEKTFRDLFADMQEGGVYAVDPIDVFPVEVGSDDQVCYQVADGHNRLRAARKAGWTKIRAQIVDLDEDSAKALNYRKNRERGTLNPIKEGRLFHDDWRQGNGILTTQQIAEKYGVSEGHVRERLGLVADLPKEAQVLIEQAKLGSSHAEEIRHTVTKPAGQLAVAQVAAIRKLSPRQTRQVAVEMEEVLKANPDASKQFLKAKAEYFAQQTKTPCLPRKSDFQFICPRCQKPQAVYCAGERTHRVVPVLRPDSRKDES